MSKTSLTNSLSWSSVFRLLALTLLPIILFAACRPSPTQPIQPASSPSPQSASPQNVSATGPAGFPPAVLNQPYPGTGIVRIINRKEGWIEIDHEEIKGLMPAMQMEFWVKDKSLLDRAKVGDRVDFVIVETEKGEYLTEIKKKD
jgi:Cu/Ag efflux protein CusF